MSLRGSSRRSPRRALVVPVVLAAALSLAACGGGGDDKKAGSSKTPTPSSTPTPTPVPVYSKLSGLDIKTEPTHPTVIVKIDNTKTSQPQLGLGRADLITEEMVEGGITRLAVFFDSMIPDLVGPVRSMRATDIGVVKPAKAVLVASGGAAPTVKRIAQAKIKTYTEGDKNYFRDKKRHAPYNLMMNLTKLVSGIKSTDRPGPFIPFATDETGFPAGQAAPGMTVKFPSNKTIWKYDGTKYVNTNTNADKTDQFYPDTVLVLRVAVGDAGYKDPAGNPVPETKFTGTGEAMIFHKGQLVRGTWSKASLEAPLTLATVAGPLQLPPGKIWMELLPKTNGSVVVDTPPATTATTPAAP